MASDPGVETRGGDELEPSAATTPNLTRETVFDVGRALLLRFRLDGGATAGWHSHGEREGYGVVLDGRVRIEYGTDGETVEVGSGEFFRMPAGLVHRGGNPDDDPAVGLIALVGRGDPVVGADGPSAPTASRTAPRVAGEDDLVPTGMLKNLTRLTPFPDAPVQQVRGHATGRVESEWHHHGDNDVLGYVLDGEGYVEWGTGDGERELARAGEFFRVPAGVVHRDVNPSEDEQNYLLWLTGTEPRIEYVDAPGGETGGASTETG